MTSCYIRVPSGFYYLVYLNDHIKGGGFLMNVAQMVTQPWGSDGLNNFKPDVLTKFGFLFGFLYVLEIADIPFIPERNTIALVQALILAPGIVSTNLIYY